MPLDVGELVARLKLERDGFQGDLRQSGDDFRNFGREVERTVNQAGQAITQIGTAGRQAGQELGDGLGRGVQQGRREAEQQLEQLRREMERLRGLGNQTGDELGQGLGQGAGRGRQEVEAELDRIRREMERLRQQAGQAGQDAGRELGQGIRDGAESGGTGLSGGIFDDILGGAEEAGNGAGAGVVGGITSRIAGAGGPIGAAVATALAVQVGIPMLAGQKIADLVFEGFDIRARQAQTNATFGWNEAQAAAAGEAAAGAYVNAWGESTDENRRAAGIAIQSGLLDGNATAEQMQPVIEQLQIVSTLMGEEIPTVARAAGQMIKTGMVDSPAAAFDLLTAAQQNGLNISEDILDTMVEYGTQFRKVGIDGADAMGLISQAMRGGARDTDVAADAIKEFSIRAQDGSESTLGAFQTLGLNAEEMTKAFAEGGPAARKGLDLILDKMRELPPDVNRAEVAFALFGTQWEDLGGAFDEFDLSTARDELGDFAGATTEAGTSMSTAAGGIEGAKRSIEVAVSGMKADLSDAFAPAATDLATWFTSNREEITAFLTEVAKGIGTLSGLTITFVGGFISGMGHLVKYLGDAGGFILSTFSDVVEGIGNMVKEVPGMEGIGNSLVDAAGRSEDLAQKLYGAGDGMIAFGQKVGEAGFKVAQLSMEIGNLPAEKPITIDTPGGQETLNLLREMGAKVTTDNNKQIVVEAPLAQPVLDKLREIGLEARIVDGKTVIAKLDDNEFNNKIAYITNPVTKKVTIDWQNTDYRAALTPGGPLRAGPGMPGPATPYADGGWTGPGGKYQPAGIVHADEFVVSKQSRQAIESQYPGALDYMNQFGKLPGYAEGGRVLDSLIAIQRQVAPGLQMTSGVRSEPGSFHNTGQAGDFSNGSSNTPEMLSFARYMAANYGAALAELIYHDPAFSGQQVDEGKIVPDSFFAGAGDHTNHVHLAAHNPLPLPSAAPAPQAQPQAAGATTVPLIQKPDGTWTSPDPAWAALIARESGGNPTITQGVQDANSGGNEATGLFQIARGTWTGNGGEEFAPIAGQATPQQQAIVAARIFEKSGGQPWGAGLPGRENEDALRAGLVSSAPSAPPAMPGAPSTTPGATADSTSTTTTSRGAPPEDPSVATFTFQNPLEPWWWKGEREYRQRIIDDYEKQKAWDEYWTKGPDGGDASKGKKVTVKSIEEATKDLADAQSDLAIAIQRQKEQKPDAPQSSKMTMQKSVDDANEKVEEAKRELEKAKANPSGYYYEPEAGQGAAAGGLPGPAKRMAAGGTIPGVGNTDSELILGMPGEEIIRKSVAEQPGMRRFLKAINAGAVDAPVFANGGTVGAGFGGYVHDDSDVMAPKNWRDWMGLATGAGFAAYNLAEPFVNAAVTGKVDLGNITPQLNTGTTDTGMVTGLVSNVAGQISSQLEELIWAVKEGKNITVKIDGANDPFNAPQIAARRA
ncbi:phage tail tape measure protein [uncultured Gordonia sp.]|uniref:phage tail tape measure protein n=1 Tax=uncultured Gordonia sp. TaxID=198437 RepID=UPI00258F1010|nr:phage tail tape measure protein [uncultured Gordonia sp.]